MGRATATTRAQIDQQSALQNQINQQLLSQRASDRATLLLQYQALLTSGYSPEEQAAITGQSEGALGSTFDALRDSAANRMARTRNSAGFGETLDELGREQGRQAAGVAERNQIQFADEAQRRKLEGLQGLASLFGVDTGLLAHGLGIPADLLRSRAAASGGGGIGNSIIGALGQIGSAALNTFGG